VIFARAFTIVCSLLLPAIAQAQSLNIDLGAAGEPGAAGRLVQITALVTVLSLAPSLLVMITAFTRIVIVLSLLRSALSTQGTPPNILPFMVIDMVVASVLMSLGMMMLPPSVVSLPFKLIFFVLVDGWRLVSGSLVQSFSTQ
jgi:flagellar biosynthesis protein FliP